MEQVRYEIRVTGHLGPGWSDWFDGLTLTNLGEGQTLISGHLPDQAALYGVLTRLSSLNLTLLELRRLTPDAEP